MDSHLRDHDWEKQIRRTLASAINVLLLRRSVSCTIIRVHMCWNGCSIIEWAGTHKPACAMMHSSPVCFKSVLLPDELAPSRMLQLWKHDSATVFGVIVNIRFVAESILPCFG